MQQHPLNERAQCVPLSKSAARKSVRAKLRARVAPVVIGAAVALGAASTQSYAASFDESNDLKQAACGAVGCGDGARECATVSGSGWSWMYIYASGYPLIIPIPWAFNARCYEKAAE